jgi:hypothetical protein
MLASAGAATAANDDLDLDLDIDEAGKKAKAGGVLQFDLARTYADREHWSMARSRRTVCPRQRSGFKWKISGRADADAVFAIDSGFYPDAVRRDQQYQFDLRETYVDFSVGDVDVRLGRQHIVWGEMVGLFFADVVSARDLRTFYLLISSNCAFPSGQRVQNTISARPTPSWSGFPRPATTGSASRVPSSIRFLGERTCVVKSSPTARWEHQLGRASVPACRWLGCLGLYYRSLDVAQTFYVVGLNEFQPRHDRITQSAARWPRILRVRAEG